MNVWTVIYIASLMWCLVLVMVIGGDDGEEFCDRRHAIGIAGFAFFPVINTFIALFVTIKMVAFNQDKP